jgi:hypothetical protein
VTTRPSQSWTGIAENYKDGAYLSGADVYVDLPGDQWPRSAEGKHVVVSGIAVIRHDLPVFVPQPNAQPMQGIPVLPGTDLNKASARTVIENPQWSVLVNTPAQ